MTADCHRCQNCFITKRVLLYLVSEVFCFCTGVYFEERPSLSTTHTTHHLLHYSAERVGRHSPGSKRAPGQKPDQILFLLPTPPCAIMHIITPVTHVCYAKTWTCYRYIIGANIHSSYTVGRHVHCMQANKSLKPC